jgi:uroporphyrinogen-III synthase
MAEVQPLAGLTVVVTRAKTQASVLTEKLVELGANAVGVATIEIVAPAGGGVALRAALRASADYDLIVVASPNGARVLASTVDELGLDADQLPPVACVGPSTAAKLAASALQVVHVPDRAVAEGLVESLGSPTAGNRLLLVQAEVARDALEVGLTANGWSVDRVVAYRTVDAQVGQSERDAARLGDIVTFTSSSTVERFVRLVGTDVLPLVVASIGPITSATAVELGLTVDIEADPHTIDGLVAAITSWAERTNR